MIHRFKVGYSGLEADANLQLRCAYCGRFISGFEAVWSHETGVMDDEPREPFAVHPECYFGGTARDAYLSYCNSCMKDTLGYGGVCYECHPLEGN